MGNRHEKKYRRIWQKEINISKNILSLYVGDKVMVIDATVLLTSSVVVSLISLAGSVMLYKMNRKAALEDRHDEIKSNVEALQKSLNQMIKSSLKAWINLFKKEDKFILSLH